MGINRSNFIHTDSDLSDRSLHIEDRSEFSNCATKLVRCSSYDFIYKMHDEFTHAI